MNDDTDARAREIAAGPLTADNTMGALARKRLRAELSYMRNGGRGRRGAFTDETVARLARVLVRSVGEEMSVALGVADWKPCEAVYIPGLGGGMNSSHDAEPNELGRAVARLLASQEVDRGE